MDVFDLQAVLSLNKDDYETGLNDAKTSASSWGQGIKTAMGVGAVAIGAVTTAITGASVAFGKGISNVADYTDHIDKQSQKMNMSAESYQEWSAVMEHCGTTIDSMQASMKTLANAVESGNDAFEQLGLSQEELANMSQEEIFSSTITALQNVEDETQRTYLAGQLLGRGATELGALLNTSAEDTQAMKDRVQELGGVMSDDAVKAGASFKDSLQDMSTAFTGLKNNMLADFLPSVTTVMDGLTEIFAGNSSEGIGMMTEGIESFINNLSELIPELTEVGGGIMTALISAITENLDSILTAGADVMTQLADALLDNLPTIIDTGAQVLGKIAEGILESLPELADTGLTILENLMNGIGENLDTIIPTVVSVILEITNTLIQHLPELIEAGVTIFVGLIEGLTTAIPMIVEEIPTLIDSIISALVEGLPLIMEASVTVFMALVEALPEIIDALADALPQVIDAIVDFITGDGLASLLYASEVMFFAIVQAIPSILSSLLSSLANLITSVVSAIAGGAGQLLSGAKEFFGKLVEGLKDKASEVISTLKSKISEWVQAIASKVNDFKDAGKNLLTGLWNGISDKAQWVYNQITNMGSTIVNKVKSIFGIASPSKVMRQIGNYLVEGLGLGWEDEIGKVNKDIEDSLKYDAEMDVSANYRGLENIADSAVTAQTIEQEEQPITVNIWNVVDGEVVGKTSYKYTKDKIEQDSRADTLFSGGYY